MEITDIIMFIPINNYNLKQTEYKLRGFCQIVEELGAKNIEIIFKNSDSTEIKKNSSAQIGDDIEIIAGNLGLNNTNKKEQNYNYSYNLSYPGNSTINLNERLIKNNIKNNKFIVSDSIFKSTLELQYLVHSRCRHLIDTYSTIFTFDNANIIDKSIYLKLKSHGITIGGNYNYQNNNKNNIIIITKVTFYSLTECKNIISGNNVSLDEVGFNHIMESIQLDDFKEKGVYKIMNFINCYINDILKNTKYYDVIHNISSIIKKELTIKDYADVLCNYFNKESKWIQFNNFIDILCKKTSSYDKLGFIIFINDTVEIYPNIIKFIQEICIYKNIIDKFWKMLQPYNKSLEYDLNNKLVNEYILNNWYSMNMLIESINSYTINFDTNLDEKLKQLINNMEVGYKYWEYYTNVLPFILKYANYTPNEIYMSTMFEKSININSFLVCKINNICDLKEFIEKKYQRIKEALDIKNSLTSIVEINDFCKAFEKNSYILKKIQYIMKVKSIANIKKILNLSDCVVNENSINLFLNKIFTYNEKLDIKKIPKNYIGYQMVLDNYNSGLPEEEFEKTVLPFLDTTKDKLTIDEFNIYSSSYFEILQYINKKV